MPICSLQRTTTALFTASTRPALTRASSATARTPSRQAEAERLELTSPLRTSTSGTAQICVKGTKDIKSTVLLTTHARVQPMAVRAIISEWKIRTIINTSDTVRGQSITRSTLMLPTPACTAPTTPPAVRMARWFQMNSL